MAVGDAGAWICRRISPAWDRRAFWTRRLAPGGALPGGARGVAVAPLLDQFVERRAAISPEDQSPSVQRFREMIGRDEKMLIVFEWIRTAAKSDIAVLDLLGLARTGRFESVPESAFLGLDLPAGWFLVYYTDHFAGELDATAMQLSVGCEIVLGRMDEGRMCSMASGWKRTCFCQRS